MGVGAGVPPTAPRAPSRHPLPPWFDLVRPASPPGSLPALRVSPCVMFYPGMPPHNGVRRRDARRRTRPPPLGLPAVGPQPLGEVLWGSCGVGCWVSSPCPTGRARSRSLPRHSTHSRPALCLVPLTPCMGLGCPVPVWRVGPAALGTELGGKCSLAGGNTTARVRWSTHPHCRSAALLCLASGSHSLSLHAPSPHVCGL